MNEHVSQGLHIEIPKWVRCRCAPWSSEPQEKFLRVLGRILTFDFTDLASPAV